MEASAKETAPRFWILDTGLIRLCPKAHRFPTGFMVYPAASSHVVFWILDAPFWIFSIRNSNSTLRNSAPSSVLCLLSSAFQNFSFSAFAALFSQQNKDACGQRHNVEEENGWPELQAEP
jgi:hypothetical protein